MLFVCPKCGEAMTEDGRIAVCKNKHSYDKSREGYVNLLLTSRGGTHGDNREMVLARRRFLARGYYRPLADKVAEAVLRVTPRCGTLLDAGSGEGYYTDIAEQALTIRDGESSVHAFDISKEAVREVSKKNKRINLAVAGSYAMPLADGSVCTVMNTFSPLAREEVHRVLREDGAFVMAVPGEEHLYDLKEILYDTPYKNTYKDPALEGFELLSEERIKYRFNMESREEIMDLFMMTPYAYRTPKESRGRLIEMPSLECTADFILLTYRKLKVE